MVFVLRIQKLGHIVNMISPHPLDILGRIAHSNDTLIDVCFWKESWKKSANKFVNQKVKILQLKSKLNPSLL